MRSLIGSLRKAFDGQGIVQRNGICLRALINCPVRCINASWQRKIFTSPTKSHETFHIVTVSWIYANPSSHVYRTSTVFLPFVLTLNHPFTSRTTTLKVPTSIASSSCLILQCLTMLSIFQYRFRQKICLPPLKECLWRYLTSLVNI